MFNCLTEDGHYDSEEKRLADEKLWQIIRYYELMGIQNNSKKPKPVRYIQLQSISTVANISFDDLMKAFL